MVRTESNLITLNRSATSLLHIVLTTKEKPDALLAELVRGSDKGDNIELAKTARVNNARTTTGATEIRSIKPERSVGIRI
jgi:hypothetical protein